MRILVVDDSGTMRRIIKNALIAIGLTDVVEAEDGKEGLHSFESHSFDLVITDWNMPEVCGLTLIQEIRKKSRVPILMVTTVAHRTEVIKALKAGVNNYMIKPMRPEVLKEKLVQMFPNQVNWPA